METLDRLRLLVAGPMSWQRLAGLTMVGLGWLLSPLCWWNDVLFNLPVAVGFAKMVELWRPEAFLPAVLVGYWLSNVVGIVLMQSGMLRMLPGEHPPNSRKELTVGLLTSSLYTLAVAALVQVGWLKAPLDLLDAVGRGHGI